MAQQPQAGRPLGPLSADLEPEVRDFARRLREILRAMNATFVQLETELHLDTSTLSRYFSGKALPELGFLDALFDVLHARVGYPAAPEMRRSTRELYDAALEARKSQRLEVYRLREEVEAANRRAEQAEEELLELQAEIRGSRSRQRELERDLRELAAHVSQGLSPELERLRDEQLSAVAARQELELRIDQQTREFAEKLLELRALEEAYSAVVALLQEAEARLERELRERWEEAELLDAASTFDRRTWRVGGQEADGGEQPAIAGSGSSSGERPFRPPRPGTAALRNWRVRSRLFALVLVPLLVSVTLAATRIEGQIRSVQAFMDAERLATIDQLTARLLDSVRHERDIAVESAAGDAGVVAAEQDTARAVSALHPYMERKGVPRDSVLAKAVDDVSAGEAMAAAAARARATGESAVDVGAAYDKALSKLMEVPNVNQSRAAIDAQVKQARHRAADAELTLMLNVGAILGVLVVVLFLTVVIARSLVRPLLMLRSSALEVAYERLPETVSRLLAEPAWDGPEPVPPIALSSTDEVGQVARAFDEVHREAVRLATEQAMLRNNVTSLFVTLSQRSQNLLQRQLRLLSELREGGQPAEQLPSSLFRLDHLASRIRRNGENLLVLAGEEPVRRWRQPVPVGDLLRAAVSEVDQYDRIVVSARLAAEVVEQAANDVALLVAELAENGAAFSSQRTEVRVTAHPLGTGGVMVEIQDSGVGMSQQRLDEVNENLANPPLVDPLVSRHLGLFVVSRLAARQGIRVRLRPTTGGGVTASVLIPASLIVAGTSTSTGTNGDRAESREPALPD